MKNENYEIGYAKPPKAAQFKKGTSGNPNGRPPKQKEGETSANALWDEMMTLTVASKSKRLSRRKIEVMRTVDKILKEHDLDAIAHLFELRNVDVPKGQSGPIIIAEQEDGSFR